MNCIGELIGQAIYLGLEQYIKIMSILETADVTYFS